MMITQGFRSWANNTGFEDNAAEMSRKSNKTAANHHVLANPWRDSVSGLQC